MAQAPNLLDTRSKVASVLLLDKDKLLQSIFRLSSFLTAPSNVNEILVKILDEVVDSIGFDKGIIRLFDDSRQNLEAKVVKNYNPEEAQWLSTSMNTTVSRQRWPNRASRSR
jgi:uncharacterized protein YigA (DUF484 family)